MWVLPLGSSLVTQMIKKICLQCRRLGFDPWVRKIPWRKEWLPTPVFWLREFRGQRSLSSVQFSSVTQSCLTLCDLTDYRPPGSSVHVNSLGKNTEVHSHSFFQGIFLIQGSNLGLLNCRQILYHLSQPGKPKVNCTHSTHKFGSWFISLNSSTSKW